MRKRAGRAAVQVMTVAACLGLGASPAGARDDWQLWMEQKWSVELLPSLKLAGKTEERYRQDMSDFYSQTAAVGLAWRPVSWIQIEPAYHYQWTEGATRDTNEHRLYLAMTPGWSWGPVHVEDRQRIEFRHINGVEDWRYRHRPRVSVRVGRGWAAAEPYVMDEVFYGARAGAWGRNRLTAGVKKPLAGHFASDLYYVVQSDRSGRAWSEFHVLGLAVSVKF